MRNSIILAAVLVLLLACVDSTNVMSPKTPVGNMALRADVSALPTLAKLAVHVTGSNMAPIDQQFPRSADTVSGTLTIPVGPARVFLVSALDSLGDTTHVGSATADVKAGLNPPLQIILKPKAATVPLTILIEDQ
jgi:hypothetical protein